MGGRLADAGKHLSYEGERLSVLGLEEGLDLPPHLLAQHGQVVGGCGDRQEVVDRAAQSVRKPLNGVHARSGLFVFEPADISVY